MANASSLLARVGTGIRRTRTVAKSDLADRLDDAIDEGTVTQDERNDAILADVVATAVRRDTGAPAWVVAEVSTTVSTTLWADDATRARERSSTIGRGLGVEVVTVGVCEAVEPGLDTEGATVVVHRDAEAA